MTIRWIQKEANIELGFEGHDTSFSCQNVYIRYKKKYIAQADSFLYGGMRRCDPAFCREQFCKEFDRLPVQSEASFEELASDWILNRSGYGWSGGCG